MRSQKIGRQDRISAYKAILRKLIDQRPSGIRQKIAEVTGTHKSFISQITKPSDSTPLPSRHLEAIFGVCHLSPEERRSFLDKYYLAHPEYEELKQKPERKTKTVHVQVPVLASERKQRELEALIRDTVQRICEIIE